METCSVSHLFRIKRRLGGVLSFIQIQQRLWECQRRAQSLCRRVGEPCRGNSWCVVVTFIRHKLKVFFFLGFHTFHLNRNVTVKSMFLLSNCRKCFLFLLQLSHSLKSSGCTSGLPAAPTVHAPRVGEGRREVLCVFTRRFLKPPQHNNKLLKLSFCTLWLLSVFIVAVKAAVCSET